MISYSISNNIPPQIKILNIVMIHSNAFLHFRLKMEFYKPHKAVHHPTKCDVINDVKLIINLMSFKTIIYSNRGYF